MTSTPKAVFLSYASQDAEAARRICDGLRAAGIEVWFDRSELRGGDSWDAQIRRQIRECSLFAPVVSAHTEARTEGYFRLEWKLAVDRSHLMSDDQAFLLPIAVDATSEAQARVPEKFREVQWTLLPGGAPTFEFVERVRRLLAVATPAQTAPTVTAAPVTHQPAPMATSPVPTARPRKGFVVGVLAATLAVAGIGMAYFRHTDTVTPSTPPPGTPPRATGFVPPPHSVAVLPFANMSGDPKQEYFTDGLSEELLNSLATIRDLQVAARTSSFSFKGSSAKLADIGRDLNVGTVLEGSMRKDGNHVRITAQLVNTVTGFHLWSQTYDRDLKNVLALQTEIAAEVTKALQVTLLSDAASAIEEGGTQDVRAFDAYLRAERLRGSIDAASIEARIASYDEALHRDPRFAKAYAGKANAFGAYGGFVAASSETGRYFSDAVALAQKAVALAPRLGRAHAALAGAYLNRFEFSAARDAQERALALAPGDADVLNAASSIALRLNHPDVALATAERAVALDPLNAQSNYTLGLIQAALENYRAALQALDRAYALNPGLTRAISQRGLVLRKLGDPDGARRACESAPRSLFRNLCLAILDHEQGRQPEAQAELTSAQQDSGDSAAYQYAEIYAQWGDTSQALKWLETAYRLRDPGLTFLTSDRLIDPIRREPRFQAIVRELNFPQ